MNWDLVEDFLRVLALIGVAITLVTFVRNSRDRHVYYTITMGLLCSVQLVRIVTSDSLRMTVAALSFGIFCGYFCVRGMRMNKKTQSDGV